jgi:hypothetical protein
MSSIKRFFQKMLIMFCLGTLNIFCLMASDSEPPKEVETEATPESAYEEQRRLEEELLAGPGDEDGVVVNPSILDVTMEDAEPAAVSKEPHGTTPAANPNAGAAGVSNANPIEGACGVLTKPDTTASRNVMGHLSSGGVGAKTTNPLMGPPVTPKNSAKSNKIRMYEAAKKACKIAPIPNLHGGSSVVLAPVGGLVTEADNRWQDIKIHSDLSTGVNVSYSFGGHCSQA